MWRIILGRRKKIYNELTTQIEVRMKKEVVENIELKID
jgi:hypothetical protein